MARDPAFGHYTEASYHAFVRAKPKPGTKVPTAVQLPQGSWTPATQPYPICVGDMVCVWEGANVRFVIRMIVVTKKVRSCKVRLALRHVSSGSASTAPVPDYPMPPEARKSIPGGKAFTERLTSAVEWITAHWPAAKLDARGMPEIPDSAMAEARQFASIAIAEAKEHESKRRRKRKTAAKESSTTRSSAAAAATATTAAMPDDETEQPPLVRRHRRILAEVPDVEQQGDDNDIEDLPQGAPAPPPSYGISESMQPIAVNGSMNLTGLDTFTEMPAATSGKGRRTPAPVAQAPDDDYGECELVSATQWPVVSSRPSNQRLSVGGGSTRGGGAVVFGIGEVMHAIMASHTIQLRMIHALNAKH
jgi:hypothetical protein